MPNRWDTLVRQWHAENLQHKAKVNSLDVPNKNEEYLLYQILCASLPFDGLPDAAYKDRIKAYMRKAIAESKTDTDWAIPDESRLAGCNAFVESILDQERAIGFWNTFLPFAKELAKSGMIFSLTQTILKLTAPGVPDIYQGCEVWDLSLVDPDNRRAVDFEARRRGLEQLKGLSAEAAMTTWPDGRIKLLLMQAALRFRRNHAALFRNGTYQPVAIKGPAANQFIAFHREHAGQNLLVVATIRIDQTGGTIQQDVHLCWPVVATWQDIFSKRTIDATASSDVRDILGTLPVAVLYYSSKKT